LFVLEESEENNSTPQKKMNKQKQNFIIKDQR